jgi:hypothetical protein
MSLVGPVLSSSVNAGRFAGKRARQAEKIKPGSSLRASLPDEAESEAEIAQDGEGDSLAQSGTVTDVPIGHGQSDFNFTPTFITQLLGQLLPDPERKDSNALSAYKELHARIRMFDRLL